MSAISETDIVAAFGDGTLALRLSSWGWENSNDLALSLAKLHNGRDIDLTEIVNGEGFAQLSGPQFFAFQTLMCKAIPALESSLGSMLQLVGTLVERGGADLAAWQPNDALRAWLRTDAVRSKMLVEAARNGDSIAIHHLTFALEAKTFFPEACNIAVEFEGERRWCALTAISRMDTLSKAERLLALAAVKQVLESDQTDESKASCIHATLSLADRKPLLARKSWEPLLEIACLDAGANARHACAGMLLRHSSFLSGKTTGTLLQPLLRVDASHKGTLDALDLGLCSLLKTTNAVNAIDYVSRVVQDRDGEIRLASFDSFLRDLMKSPYFQKTLVEWLLSGDLGLCGGLGDAVSADLVLDVDFSQFHLEPPLSEFVARKAIGFFFFKPIVAASILVSLLRSGDPASKAAITSLLFDPLLINYGGQTVEYLTAIQPDDAAYDLVHDAMASRKRYLEGLRSAGTILELRPSETNRQIERRLSHDRMLRAMKEAESVSPLLSAVSRSTILYGHRSLTHVMSPSGQSHRVPMELKEFSTTIELPRLSIVDPQGLDYMLRVFRAERLKN